MADLDDFFAKRDKKKGKTKKYSSPEELVKQLEVNTLKEKELSSKNSKPEKIDEETEVNVEVIKLNVNISSISLTFSHLTLPEG